jgi:hypothetical protein
MLVLIPALSFASSSHKKETVRQGVITLIDWKDQQLAKDIRSKYHMEDVEWLSWALGKKVDGRTSMLYVLITDAASHKYWHHHMNFKHPYDPTKEIYFPRWLPRSWFMFAKGPVVNPPRLFGALYQFVYKPQPAPALPLEAILKRQETEEGELVDVMDDE